MDWAPILPSSPIGIPTPSPGRALLPWPSPDPSKEPIDDDPLSNWGEGDGDQEMPDANEQQGVDNPADPGTSAQRGTRGSGWRPGGGWWRWRNSGAQRVSGAWRAPRTLWGHPSSLSDHYPDPVGGLQSHQWQDTDSHPEKPGKNHCWRPDLRMGRLWGHPSMAGLCQAGDELYGEKLPRTRPQLLADAQKARKDALDSSLELIPEEHKPRPTPAFPKASHLLAPVLAVALRHTDEALHNIHTQLVDLGKEHIPKEQARAFFNTILQVSCSLRQEMDNMATNQVFLPSQIVPNLWGSHRGLSEGLSLLGPPSCLASWPASLVEQVTAVPACQNVPIFPLPERQKQLLIPGGNHTNRPNKPPGYSGRTRQGEQKMQRHANWKKSARRSPLGLCSL